MKLTQIFENQMRAMMNSEQKKQGENNIINEDLISTKANTLSALKGMLKKSSIEDMYVFTVGDYEDREEAVIDDIMNRFVGETIIVRSSSTNEDSLKKSNAGHYTSVLDVDSGNAGSIMVAVSEVITSYEADILDVRDQQILVQHQAVNVAYSGVLFTYDIQGRRPYYLINYIDNGSTDYVTSGHGGKTLWIARNADTDELETQWKNLLISVKEIENIFGIPLDIEFAVNSLNEVIIFQVRPLVADFSKIKNKGESREEFYHKIDAVKDKYDSIKSVLDGGSMVLSDMAFWNPSEIIGTGPRNLDYSLYRYIITQRAWNEGLVPMGYRKLEEDLMYQLGNKPYISIDYSFYTLIPSSIDEELAMKLVDFYRKKLEKDTTAHDKVEFEIVFSSYDFSTEKATAELLENGFTAEERDKITASLKDLTFSVIKNHRKISERDNEDIARLEKMRRRIYSEIMDSDQAFTTIGYILKLLNGIKKYGTPQFTRQARMAFMARSFCSSLVEAGYFDAEEIDEFMKSISTVSSEFEQDFQKFSRGIMSRDEFNARYGHLRSGTYDIRTDSYNQMVFKPAEGQEIILESKPERAELNEEKLGKALFDIGFDIEPSEFNDFLRMSIEGREYFKFQFTKSLSYVLDLIQSLGKKLDIGRNDLSYLTVENLIETCYEDEYTIKNVFSRTIAENKAYHRSYRNVMLPDVILNRSSISVIPVNEARPNFITSKKVAGEVVNLEHGYDEDLMDKIVMIPKADPGYEWIFTKGIRGFITKYGGMASHMAIRCAEFQIPAAIGCGEKIYNYASKISYMELDCANGTIKEGLQCADLRALITQREGVNQYGDPTDVLEASYVRFYELLGFVPQPASNYVRNVGKLFEKHCDLLIVTGGGALPGRYYDVDHNEGLQPNRDAMEERLIKHCIGEEIPIICTCRGMQYMNVLFGGSLLYHPKLKVKRPRGVDHKVHLVEEDRDIWVNNFHADVVTLEGLAPCFKPLAIDEENGTVEAFGSEEMKILALQWHPERKFATAEALEETRKLVINFILKHIK